MALSPGLLKNCTLAETPSKEATPALRSLLVMTATQLLERLATSMLATAFPDADDAPEGVEMVDSHAKTTEIRATQENDTSSSDTGGIMPRKQLSELPAVVLEHMCSYLDHASLHAVENTSIAMYNVTKQSDVWKDLALQSLVVADANARVHSWKQMLCLSSGPCQEDKDIIKGLKAYSSADRPSETPQNTLKPSRCWREMNRYKHREALTSLQEFYDVPTFVMTLGERIQRRCGCSSGSSCYWSSSASTDQNATDYIDYILDGPCVVSSVQILPYRVFWHPGSPTYGPQQMMVEFYERSIDNSIVDRPRGQMIATASEIVPFYQSPIFPIKNDMELQDIQLPVRVWASGSTVMRVRLLGRHQAQTFELPLWMQRTDEDRLPKYYCCVSYLNAVGLSRETVLSPQEAIPCRKRIKLEMEAVGVQSSLADIMAACFETMMEQRRRIQSLGSPPS